MRQLQVEANPDVIALWEEAGRARATPEDRQVENRAAAAVAFDLQATRLDLDLDDPDVWTGEGRLIHDA